jgi:hypothetical protein
MTVVVGLLGEWSYGTLNLTLNFGKFTLIPVEVVAGVVVKMLAGAA